jgi:hypothetical protein
VSPPSIEQKKFAEKQLLEHLLANKLAPIIQVEFSRQDALERLKKLKSTTDWALKSSKDDISLWIKTVEVFKRSFDSNLY